MAFQRPAARGAWRATDASLPLLLGVALALAWRGAPVVSAHASSGETEPPAPEGPGADGVRVNVSVDYGAFLSRSDLVWAWDATERNPPPNGWWTMAFTGNGMLGAMVTAGNDTAAAGDIGSVRIELGRSDVTDDRMPNSPHATGETTKCDRNRLPIGYFQLETAGRVVSGSMRLSLYHAEVRGQVVTTKGSVNFTVLTHATQSVNVVNYAGAGGEAGAAAWSWHSRQGDSPWSDTVCKSRKYVGNPPLASGSDERTGVRFSTQPLLSGASYSTAWSERVEADGSATLLVSTSRPQTDANAYLPTANTTASSVAAAAEVTMALGLGWRALRSTHRQWWHSFYKASFVSLGEPRVEAFYWAQMYKLASATRANQPGPSYGAYDHTGPWFTPSDTCCPLFNWDMNLPVQYQVIFSSNHPELGYSLTRLLSDPLVYADLESNAAWINTSTTPSDPDLVVAGPNGITSFRFIENGGTRLPAYQTNLLWVLVNVFNLFRATLDAALLPPLYSILRASVNHQLHLAFKGSDGKWHLPPTASPEYPVGCDNGCAGGDSTYHVALFKWGLQTLPKLCALLGCDEPRHETFDDVLNNLAGFAVSPDLPVGSGRGLHISRDVVVNTSHRHYSHLLPCWNTGLLSWDDPAERKLCLDSLDNWHGGCNRGACARGDAAGCVPTSDMTWEWDGFSYPASVSFNARAGRADAAWGNLTVFLLGTVWPSRQLTWGCPHGGAAWPGSSDTKCIGSSMQPNTFQGENGRDGHADPTSETPLAIASAIQDLLTFSDDATDAFRVFWGLPGSVDASFFQLRVAGAFVVSSKRVGGRTLFVAVRATADATPTSCAFFPPPDWAGADLAAAFSGGERGAATAIRKSATEPGAWVMSGFTAGAEAVVYPAGRVPAGKDLTIAPVDGDARLYNWWGYHDGGAGRDKRESVMADK